MDTKIIDAKRRDILLRIGGVVLLTIIFGVPAVMVPMAMKDVPKRSETKTLTTYQEAINIVQRKFDRHEHNQGKRRLMPLHEYNPCRLPAAHVLNNNRVPYAPIEFHSLYPRPLSKDRKATTGGVLLRPTTRQSGRFSGGLLLRRSQS